MTVHPMLIAGTWQAPAATAATFSSRNPNTGETFPDAYPVATAAEIDALLDTGLAASIALAATDPAKIGDFLDAYAEGITAAADELAALAHAETGLPVEPRLAKVEIPRTTGQLKQAAAAARAGDWRMPVIDTANNLRSQLEPLAKPVLVIGPNNFPFAFNGIAGGDFAAAIASGHAVIAKAHPAHPGTSQRLAEIAFAAVQSAGLPAATVQLYYRSSHEEGHRMASDPRLGAIGFTGSEGAGRKIKAAADAVGKPAYFELSSVNPVAFLPGALAEKATELATEFSGSCLLGVGQFCTNPGLLLTIAGDATETFLATAAENFNAAPSGVMLVPSLPTELDEAVVALTAAGAEVIGRGTQPKEPGFRAQPALLRVSGATFLENPAAFQREMFGPGSLVVVAADADELAAVAAHLDSSLTAAFYTASDGSDDALYDRLVPIIAPKAGRLLNDKMPTGVAVSPAMVHGGPFPAGGHPGFTAVGIPASLRRFGALRCYDNVRPNRLPATLQDKNPTGTLWRCIDGSWTQADIG
ncbi:aldehyde dehydrogenase family protein [Actomonas aquatica]|uniref:Aldehyde dehydrogenase family protein n=1 Tax=Actomonas aquatica TaxID=2866162 RepID=A0ABZ1C826_9BACT|nr:aldehyde dehydrogenase family protein [Opitutus sp. WL0086]WRQ87790.1 aldehyde dehydrogenase family protein [Opitutus sp. WL0086]